MPITKVIDKSDRVKVLRSIGYTADDDPEPDNTGPAGNALSPRESHINDLAGYPVYPDEKLAA